MLAHRRSFIAFGCLQHQPESRLPAQPALPNPTTPAPHRMSGHGNLQRRISTWMNRRTLRKPLRLAARIAIIVVLVLLSLQILLGYFLASDPRLLPPALRQAKNLLIVTAHPDDECLFFSPSILAVLDNNPTTKGGLIVLSTGKRII